MAKQNIPIEVLSTNLSLALQILVSTKIMTQREIPFNILTIITLEDQWKDCWLSLFELFSIFFNPEKSKVSSEENYKIGLALRKTITELPYKQL